MLRWWSTTRAATAAPTGRRDRPRTTTRSWSRTPWLCSTLLESQDAVVVGLSAGGRALLGLAADHPGRVRGALFVAADVWLHDTDDPIRAAFEQEREHYGGWWRFNAHYWRRDLAGFAEFFFGEVFPEAHSTRQVEAAAGWALETDAETLVATQSPARRVLERDSAREALARVRCPALVLHGDEDRIVPLADGRALAEALGAPLEVVVGGGHCVHARHPVWFNLRVRRFVEEVGGRACA